MEAADVSAMLFSLYQHYHKNKLRALDIYEKPQMAEFVNNYKD
jgi:hypothetical protein